MSECSYWKAEGRGHITSHGKKRPVGRCRGYKSIYLTGFNVNYNQLQIVQKMADGCIVAMDPTGWTKTLIREIHLSRQGLIMTVTAASKIFASQQS